MHTRTIRAATAITTGLVRVGGVSLGAASALALVLAFGAPPASAHNYLVATTPAADSTLTALPATFSVTTNEALLDLSGTGVGFAIQVQDAAGTFYGDGCFSIVDATLSTPAALGAAGSYRLLWQIVSEDGHTVSGEFGFAWAPPPGSRPSPGSATPPVCGVAATPMSTPSSGATPPEAAPSGAARTPQPVRTNANLGDVLWIGGAIGAVLVAGLVTLLVLGRRKR